MAEALEATLYSEQTSKNQPLFNYICIQIIRIILGIHIAVIGLGYVGLPLAVEFSRHFRVTGLDINQQRIEELDKGEDRTRQIDSPDLKKADNLKFTIDLNEIKDATTFIITVPTPVDHHNAPDLTQLFQAGKMIGSILKKGDLVIYESTVYPGCTEEECIPLLETVSGLKINEDFEVGYSPERISPGDQVHTLANVVKLTSGSSPEAAKRVNQLYQTIIQAGTYQASSIKVAEAAKAIENAQRDLNISFMNELALIFDRMEIDTQEVLEAAGTKYNFLPFKPGLVGGHCIAVDPYYLSHKAIMLGYHPEVILSGRRVNDHIPSFIASKIIKLMLKKGIQIQNSRALILGITYKENCSDIRMTKVIEIYHELKDYGLSVDIYDPRANPEEVKATYSLQLSSELNKKYEVILLAVAHQEFLELNFQELKTPNSVLFDVKGILPKEMVDARL